MLSVAMLLALSCTFVACGDDEEDDITPSENNQSENSYIGTANGHDYVDLDLPSGTKWATCNVGASKPEDYGDYYAWGETATKSEYKWDTYKYGSSWDDVTNIGSNIAGTQYDVAHVKWGGNWRLPTLEQSKELFENTTSEWTTQNGVNGRKLTSKRNNMSIFFPASGGKFPYHSSEGDGGGTWLSTVYQESDQAYVLYCDDSTVWWDTGDYRCNGRTVRPVLVNQ